MRHIPGLIGRTRDIATRIVVVAERACRVGDRLLFVLLPLYLIYRGDWLSIGALAFVVLVFSGMTTGSRSGDGSSPIERDDRDYPYRRRPIHQSWRH